MNKEEANGVILEYMGWKYNSISEVFEHEKTIGSSWRMDFDKSLDALVPVWEKLDMLPKFDITSNGEYLCFLVKEPRVFFSSYRDTIQESALFATVKAILETGNE